MDTWSMQEDGIHMQITVPCAQGAHPIEVCITYEGELRLVDNPCQRLGAFSRMTELMCQSRFRSLQRGFLERSLVPAIFNQRKPEEYEFVLLYEAVRNALSGQAMSGFPKARLLLLALNGTVQNILDASQKYPVHRWGLWAQCVLVHRIAKGEKALVPTFDQGLPLRLVKGLFAHDLMDALVRVGSPAVPALIHTLQDNDNWVRWEACWALGRLADPAAPRLP